MSAVPKKLLSPAEYLAQERQAEFRSEYYRGEVFAIAGATYERNLIKANLAAETGMQLKNAPYFVLTSDLRVKVPSAGLCSYPDIVIVCDKPLFEDEMRDTLLNPCAIVEVFRDPSESFGCGDKFAHYRQIDSIREFVQAAQDRILLERYVRQPDGSWLLTVFDDPAEAFEFASVPAGVPLAAIYSGVEFPESPLR